MTSPFAPTSGTESALQVYLVPSKEEENSMLAATAKSIVGPAHTGKGSTGSKISLGIGFTVIWKAASALVQPVTALRPHTRIGKGPMGVPGAAAALNEEIPVETKLSAWGSALFESGSPAVAPPVHLNKEGELAPARFCGSVDGTAAPEQTIKSAGAITVGRGFTATAMFTRFPAHPDSHGVTI